MMSLTTFFVKTRRSLLFGLSREVAKKPASPMATFTKTVLAPGNGPVIKKNQKVTVSADLYLAAGNVAIWSTHKKEGFLFPATGPFTYQAGVGGVIKGWDDGCMTMAVGETARLEIPWNYAYGANGHPGFKIPGKSDLIFEIQILSAQ